MNKKAMGVLFSYLLIVVDIVVALFFVPFLLGSLGEDEYGLYKLLQSTASYMAVLDFGLGGTITRYIVKFKTEGDVKKQENFMAMGLLVYGALAAVVMLVAAVVVLIIPTMYASSIVPEKMQQAQLTYLLLCGSQALNLFSHAYTGLFSAHERFTYTKASSIVKVVLRVLLIIFGVRFWKSAVLVAAVDFSLALGLLILHIFYARFSVKSRVKLHKWDGKLAREALVFTSAILIQSIINQFNTNVNNMVLGIYSTAAVVTLYSLVLQLYNMYSGFSTAISNVYLPSISAAVFKGATDAEITEKVIEPSRIQLVVLLLAASGFAIVGKDFVNLWVGPGYEEVYYLVLVLMVTSLLNLSQNTITSVLKAKNKLHGKTLILAISTALNFGVTLILVPLIGIWGAVLGTSASMIFGYGVALNIYYHKVIHINMFTYYKKTYAGIVPAALLCLAAGFGISYINPLSGWIGFLAEAGCYVIIFALAMYFLGLNKGEKALVHKALAKFNRKKVG